MNFLEMILGNGKSQGFYRLLAAPKNTLYCNRCRKEIFDIDVGYDEKNGEIYHPGSCAMGANAMKRMLSKNEEEQPILMIQYITRMDAEILAKKGRLKPCRLCTKKK